MKPIKIDVSRIPDSQTKHPDYLSLLADMERGMADPETVNAVCIHEAAHMFYAVGSKMKVRELIGPQIHYVPSVVPPFVGHAAHVEILIVQNTIEEVARMLCAGGIAILELTKFTNTGDDGDFALYLRTCDDAGLTDPVARLSVWQDARAAVKSYLQDELVRAGVRKVAGDLQAQLEQIP